MSILKSLSDNSIAVFTLSILIGYVFFFCTVMLIVQFVKAYDKGKLQQYNRKQLKKRK